jgi:hypothetical protein
MGYPYSGLRAQTRDIWFCPQASIPPSPLARAVDFMDLFRPDAPWKRAASHVKVFKLYPSYAAQVPQSELDSVITDLKRRGIAIALEAGVMNVDNKNPVPACGGFGLVEGYGTLAQAGNICAKIKKAGGELRFLVMDEPLFYGHYFTKKPAGGQPGCHSSVEEIVRLIVPTLQVYQQAFPGLVIGDAEPTNLAGFPDWQQQYGDWAAGFQKAMGRPLAFLHLDIPWFNHGVFIEPDDAVAVYHFAEGLKRKGMLEKIGIIYNGTGLPANMTDAQWMQNAREHLLTLTNKLGLRPDQAIFQSWVPQPSHCLPESDPNALTNLVVFYVGKYGL